MRPGPRTIRACPHCSEPFEEPTIASGNTFGAKIWSDGKMDAPMLPEHHAFVSCPSCNEPFWVKNSEIIEALDFDDLDQTEYPNTTCYSKPTPEAYLKGLSNLAITKDEENYLRLKLMRCFNDDSRDSEVEKNIPLDQQKNWVRLLEILDNEPESLIFKAEINREMKRFDLAIDLLNKISDARFDWVIKALKSLCEDKNSKVVVIT